MKLYNPFKAHIVQFSNGKFAVRRLSFSGWEHKECSTYPTEDVYWWNWIEFTQNWCCVETYEQAVALRDRVHFKEPKPMKVVKVHG